MVRQLQGVEGGRQVDRQLEEGTIQLFKGGDHLAGKGARYDVAWEAPEGASDDGSDGGSGDGSGVGRLLPSCNPGGGGGFLLHGKIFSGWADDSAMPRRAGSERNRLLFWALVHGCPDLLNDLDERSEVVKIAEPSPRCENCREW